MTCISLLHTWHKTLLCILSHRYVVRDRLTRCFPQRPFALDFAQLLRFIVLTLLTAPPNFHWQQFLERSFPGYPGGAASAPPGDERGKDDIEMRAGSADPDVAGESSTVGVQPAPTAQAEFSWKNTWTKWFVDCITMGAIMNTVAFLIIMGLLKGQAGSQILYNIRTVS